MLSFTYKILESSFKGIKNRRNRKKQIATLNELVITYFQRIGDLEPSPDINGRYPDNLVLQRTGFFNHFLMELTETIEHGSPDLSFDEAAKIRIALESAKSLFAERQPKDDWEYIVRLGCAYRVFQRLKWMKLPPEVPWRKLTEEESDSLFWRGTVLDPKSEKYIGKD